jgi:hypothetical protein
MEIFQKGIFSLADEILTDDFVLHDPMLPSEFTRGPEGVKKFASGVVDNLLVLHTLFHYYPYILVQRDNILLHLHRYE